MEYVYIFMTYEITGNLVTWSTAHIFDLHHWDMYGCHSTNISHTADMLDGHIDSTFLHICAKTQSPAMST